MSAEPVTAAELESAVLVLIVREGGTSTLWLDEEKLTLEEAQLILRATSARPELAVPEGVPSPHE